MNYKEKIDEIKAMVFGKNEAIVDVVKNKEVELADAPEKDAPAKEAAPAVEAAPVAQYLTIQEFDSMKEDLLNKVTEMMSSFAEMINTTEKNTVPKELAKVEEVEEVVELATAPLVHDPEGLEKNELKFKIGANKQMTLEEKVMSRLFSNDTSIYN